MQVHSIPVAEDHNGPDNNELDTIRGGSGTDNTAPGTGSSSTSPWITETATSTRY